ncbi:MULTISPECIES: ABC transporter ATP-binding protein [Streptomyces]|jgi:ABC-type multidrug transport system ATPase subunit|uniref:ABC transporter ATP-binding protein n=1 Tax=Streptomyces TaxID=1883 RepID=UPI0019036214|nr:MULTISPECIES: ATP-binding cassette domain-containing protein [unclassified Streptomyces]MCU4747317.1 ATP-binding cassette domain-containing protein [Streptomyces sp. G-5]QQN77948.1 ATP-binding cassette domain-containing protein [Streptomyces sp. XC 2026]
MPVEISDCWFAYRKRPVLRGVDYVLPERRTVLLGPNGAGKSTLLSLAASVRRPQRGSISYRGIDSSDREYRRRVAWLPQHVTAMPGLTAREQVAYVGWLKGMTRTAAWSAAAEALARVELSGKQDERVTRLSGGQVRRVGVAQALVHEAEVLLLDEPTAGMDPRQRRVFRDTLAALSPEVSVLISTHDVADLAEDSEHVTVLNRGGIVYHGDVAGFLEHAPEDVVIGRRAEMAYAVLCGDE